MLKGVTLCYYCAYASCEKEKTARLGAQGKWLILAFYF